MKLRNATFGGFNKQDVIAYIEKVKNEAYEEQTRLQKQIKELKEKNAALEERPPIGIVPSITPQIPTFSLCFLARHKVAPLR